jgi:hypothetical protein
MTRVRSLLVLFLLLACVPIWADDLQTLAGKSNGTLQKITDKEIILKVGDNPVSTPLAQVLDLTLRPGKTMPSAGKFIEVQLLDESLLRCTKVTFGAKEVQLDLTTGAQVKVPLSAVVTILRDAQEESLRTQWVKILKDKRRRDRLIVLQNGELNPLEGVLGEIDAANQTIYFKLDGGKEINPKLEKVQGLQFSRTDAAPEATMCRIFDVDGNQLVASKLQFAGAQLEVTTAFGHKVALDPKTVARFDFNFGRLTYLSDLEAKIPDSILLGGFNPVCKDTNLNGDPIMLQDKKYAKGLSMYAGVEMEYNLAGHYKKFNALLGVDSQIAEEGQGKVTVTIYCDREKRGTFEVSAKAPIAISIPVTEVNILRIVVSGSNFTNYSGHATLADAHVSQ